jgi:hypothetical protein
LEGVLHKAESSGSITGATQTVRDAMPLSVHYPQTDQKKNFSRIAASTAEPLSAGMDCQGAWLSAL